MVSTASFNRADETFREAKPLVFDSETKTRLSTSDKAN
jgi:hypothetical protein